MRMDHRRLRKLTSDMPTARVAHLCSELAWRGHLRPNSHVTIPGRNRAGRLARGGDLAQPALHHAGQPGLLSGRLRLCRRARRLAQDAGPWCRAWGGAAGKPALAGRARSPAAGQGSAAPPARRADRCGGRVGRPAHPTGGARAKIAKIANAMPILSSARGHSVEAGAAFLVRTSFRRGRRS